MRYKITAPVEGVISTVAGVAFIGSVGETDSEAAVAYFKRHGYTVEELADLEPVDPPQAELPKRSASTEIWRAYAVEHGGMTAEEAADKSRDQLAEQYLGPKEGEQP